MRAVRDRGEKGFTLIELMVVIAIIGILAALLIPVIKTALLNARVTQAISNGKAIYQIVMAEELSDNYIMPSSTGTNRYATSTDYFKWLVTSGNAEVTFDVFAAHGITKAVGIDPAGFASANNAWCITEDIVESTKAYTPVLFTRNLDIQNLDEELTQLSEASPFARHKVVVIRRDGSGHDLKEESLDAAFNPAKESKNVLRP